MSRPICTAPQAVLSALLLLLLLLVKPTRSSFSSPDSAPGPADRWPRLVSVGSTVLVEPRTATCGAGRPQHVSFETWDARINSAYRTVMLGAGKPSGWLLCTTKSPCSMGVPTIDPPPQTTYTLTTWVRPVAGHLNTTETRQVLEIDYCRVQHHLRAPSDDRWIMLVIQVDVPKEGCLLLQAGFPDPLTGLNGIAKARFSLLPNRRRGHLPQPMIRTSSPDIQMKNTHIYQSTLTERELSALHAAGAEPQVAFPHCFCPANYPYEKLDHPYTCYPPGGKAAPVLRPSHGLKDGHVLVDPHALVDGQEGPYYWISSPGVDFNLTVRLQDNFQVNRLRIKLITPPPADGLKIYALRGSDVVPWLRLGGSGRPVDQSQCSTKIMKEDGVGYVLDTDTCHARHPIETSQLIIQVEGPPSHHQRGPAAHIISELEVFASAPSKGRAGRQRRQAGDSATIDNIRPLKAPVPGDLLFLWGTNLGPPNVSVSVGSYSCLCSERIATIFGNGCNNDTHIVCAVHAPDAVVGQPLQINVTLANGEAATITTTNNTFTFQPQPQVDRVSPRTSYVSGGRTVTVHGDNLDSAFEPKLVIVTRQPSLQFGLARSKPCDVLNSTQMVCVTPRLAVPSIYLIRSRRRRQANPNEEQIDFASYINDPTITFDIITEFGFYLINLNETLGVVEGSLWVSIDMKIEDFRNDVLQFELYKGIRDITLVGDRITRAATAADYDVRVGGEICNVTRISQNTLTCRPPPENQIPSDSAVRSRGLPRVTVVLTESLTFSPGGLQYLSAAPVDTVGILAGVLAAVGAIILFGIVFWCWRRNEKYKALKARQAVLDENYTRLVTDKGTLLDLLQEDLRKKVNSCRLEPHTISRNREIGQGHFGKVYIGRMSTKKHPKDTDVTETDVAIKTVKAEGVSLRQLEDFLEEAIIMMDFKHKNVLRLVGVFIEDDRPYVVLPFMSNGNLKGYVSDPKRNFRVADLIGLLAQVSNGMAYVSKQKTVHRDLRAENCMVNDKIVVKVGDFGLARVMQDDYYHIQDQARPLPVKWMAPEALSGSKFSSASDVWSFGVLMWEVMTRGLKPYSDIDNYRLKDFVLHGNRLTKPPYCPDQVYGIMLQCWELKAKSRPNFTQLRLLLRASVNQATEEMSEGVSKDEDYIDMRRDRTSTNEYIRKPGVVNQYLVVLPEDDVSVPTGGASTTTEHTNPTFDKANHKYENEAYLQPTAGNRSPPAKDADASEPYFTNPPISEDYMTEAGQQKVAQSAHPARGLLYEEKPTPTSGSDKKTEHSYVNRQQSMGDDYLNIISPDVDGSEESGEGSGRGGGAGGGGPSEGKNYLDMSANLPSSDSGGGSGGATPDDDYLALLADPVEQNGQKAENMTPDYVNNPAHKKRQAKQTVDNEEEVLSGQGDSEVKVSGVPHRGNEVDGYISCT